MTREQAIRIISGEVLGTTEQTDEAVAIAVEALKRTEKHTETHECDYISRQAAIDALNKGLDKIPMVNNSVNEMVRRDERILCTDELRALPSAQQWIPVTERLPEDKKAVLVYEVDNKNNFLAIYDDGRWKSFDPTYKETYFDETIYWNIVAWMPLPEPYKEV